MNYSKFTDPEHLRKDQYKTADNLNARIALHKNFSTNPVSWIHWVFDQYDFTEDTKVLEIGCGPGDLWIENQDKIKKNWQVTLTDLSEGMVQTNRTQLLDHNFQYGCINCQHIPFLENSFDIVISNHMLYHISNLDQAFSEIRRVLKPGGKLFAATNGNEQLIEMETIIQNFNPELKYQRPKLNFSLENGEEKLAVYFDNIKKRIHNNSLYVTEAQALVNYFLSMTSFRSISKTQNTEELFNHIQKMIIEKEGIEITKSVGLFIAENNL